MSLLYSSSPQYTAISLLFRLIPVPVPVSQIVIISGHGRYYIMLFLSSSPCLLYLFWQHISFTRLTMQCSTGGGIREEICSSLVYISLLLDFL